MNLLRIIVDEAAVTTELFCSLLNACPIIPKHRTAPWGRLPDGTADQNAPPNPNNPFAQRGGLMEDGLAANAYIGSVYANPPYNGTAIDESIAQAILATRRGGFRATYVVPMTEAKIAAFEARVIPGGKARVLVKFPANSMPFIPAAYWRGVGAEITGTPDDPGVYPNPATHIVIAVIESDDLLDLPPLDINKLRQRVASWFLSAAPRFRDTNYAQTLCAASTTAAGTDTRITVEQYLQASRPLADQFPEEWCFWKPRPAPTLHHTVTITRPYHGGHLDTHSIDTNPFLEVIRHQPEISLIGSLPPAYGEFLTTLGCPASELPRLTADIRAHLVIYLKDAWGTYGTIKASLPPAVKLVFFGPAENPARPKIFYGPINNPAPVYYGPPANVAMGNPYL